MFPSSLLLIIILSVAVIVKKRKSKFSKIEISLPHSIGLSHMTMWLLKTL